MPSLVDILVPGPGLRLLYGTVYSVVGTYVNITYNGGLIQYAGKLDANTYSAGDYVAFLLSDESGALILGKQTLGTPPGLPAPPASALIVSANAYATYDSVTGVWTASTLVQSPHQWASWFYTPSAFSTLTGMRLASFEVEVNLTTGGPPEFAAHRNLSGTGAIDLSGETYAKDSPPVGVATWVRLPLDWGHELISGTIKGIAVGGGFNTGTYSNGTGRTRLTPV